MTTASQQWAGGLAPDQQRLLLAALQSNKRKSDSAAAFDTPSKAQRNTQAPLNGLTGDGVNPSMLLNKTPVFSDVPNKTAPSFNAFDFRSSNNTFDFTAPSTGDFTDTFPDFTAEPEHEPREKRKISEDDEEDADEDDDESDNHHRQNSDERSSKKPGRKPSTSEPTTKRKAQNRAAQRAFRERKEKHLKDLETKVNELEKASESANHENSVLRVQVERLNDELKDARRRMSSNNASLYTSPTSARPPVDPLRSSSGNGFDFDFDFARFGSTSGSVASGPNLGSNGTNSPALKTSRTQSQTNGGSKSPPSLSEISSRGGSVPNTVRPNASGAVYGGGSFDRAGGNRYPTPQTGSPQPLGPSRSQTLNSAYARSSPSQSASGSSRSPGESLIGQTSSYCTSPDENWANDYQAKNINGFSVPETSQNVLNNQTPGSDFNNFDWLSSQNGGQFDPVLFGDYRESQDNILGTGDFSGGFFDEAIPPLDDSLFNDFMPAPAKSPVQPQPAKRPNLMEQVEQQRDGTDTDAFNEIMMNKIEQKATKMMTCPEVWQSLKSSQNFQSGDFDVDSLCSDLTAKAKCTESGLSLPREAVEAVLWKMATRDNTNGQSSTAT